MTRLTGLSPTVLLCGLLAACDLSPKDTVVGGGPDGVIVSYAGEVAETLPLARQYCARYERVPVFLQARENKAVYRCVRSAPS